MAKPAHDTRVGVGAVGVPALLILSLLFVVATIGLLYEVWTLWPPPAPTDATPDKPYGPFGWSREQNVLLLIALLGALGSMGYVVRSFTTYVGERNLLWSWVPLYVLTPFLAAIMASATYIVLRAGLLGTTTDSNVGNTWGFAAVAILVGLFAAQASEKLKQVFETLFTPPQPGSEKAGTEVKASITELNPSSAQVGDEVKVIGQGLQGVKAVSFVGADADASYDKNASALVTTVPAGAQNGKVSVTLPTGESIESPEEFVVESGPGD